jgi:hypothetical protein
MLTSADPMVIIPNSGRASTADFCVTATTDRASLMCQIGKMYELNRALY